MTADRWAPGTHITARSIWGGRVFAASCFVVIEDRGDVLVACTPAGTRWKRPVDLDGNDVRLPHGAWRLRDDVWRGRGMVRVWMRDVAHSVLIFLGDGDVGIWYVNLETPFRRNAIGLDLTDQHLDIIFPADLGEPRWKDEDELEEAVAFGSMTAEEAAAVRAEAERAIAWVRRGDHPAIDDRWRTWTPPAEWSVPVLAPGWDTLPPSV